MQHFSLQKNMLCKNVSSLYKTMISDLEIVQNMFILRHNFLIFDLFIYVLVFLKHILFWKS